MTPALGELYGHRWFTGGMAMRVGGLVVANVGLVLAYGVASLQGRYYFEIMLPGSIVGLLTGYATQRYGRGPRAETA